MFQIWRYRTSWQEISTPLHHDSRFFWHFLGVMVSGVTKYGQDLDWHQWVQLDMRELLTYAVWCHYSRRMTSSWQHDNSGGHFLDQCSVSSPGLYSGYSHIMYAVLLLPRYPSSVRATFTIYSGLNTRDLLSCPGASQQRLHIHSITATTITCTELKPKWSFLACPYRYPARSGSCVKMNHWHST